MIFTNVLLVSSQPEDRESVRAALDAIRGQPYRLEVVDSLADCLAASAKAAWTRSCSTSTSRQRRDHDVPAHPAQGDDHSDRGARRRGRRGTRSPGGPSRRARLPAEGAGHGAAGGQGAPLRDRAHPHAQGAQGVRAALSRALPERHGRVFQTTVDGKFMAANPALVRMLGYDSEDELLAVDVARDVYADPRTVTAGSRRWRSSAKYAMRSCC